MTVMCSEVESRNNQVGETKKKKISTLLNIGFNVNMSSRSLNLDFEDDV